MKVRVEYLAQAKQLAGVAAEDVELPEAASLRSLLQLLAERHGASLATLLGRSEAGEPGSALIFVDGEQVATGADPVLPASTTVLIGAPMSGG